MSKQSDYKTVRIHLDDFKEYKALAFYKDQTIIEVISDSLRCYQHYLDGETFEDPIGPEQQEEQPINMDELMQDGTHDSSLGNIDLTRRERLLWAKERYEELKQAETAGDDVNITREQFQTACGITEQEYDGIAYAALLNNG